MGGQHSTLVGRERELAALAGALDRAQAADGAVAMLTGEPGIGKTTLLSAVAAEATARGFEVTWGRAWEVGGAPPCWVWIEALRPLAASDSGATAERVRSLVLDAAEQAPDPFALCDAVAQFVRTRAERAPLLIVLDDLHAADVASLQIALFVARQLAGSRIAIVGSYRDVEARLVPAVEEALAKMGRAGEILSVSRLDRDAVDALVEDAVGRVDARVSELVMTATEGNPLFVRELLRLIQARAGGDPGVPSGVRAVIRERLALLSPATVALLQAAAVVGREFPIALAATVAGVTPEALEEAAAEAAGAALLEDAAPGRLRFSHALVAETLATDLSPAARARTHRKAAEALESMHAGDPAAPVVEIAHHWLQAGATATDRAVDAARRAAGVLSDRLAFADAAHWLERACDALRAADPADARGRAELLLARCEALARAGDRTAAEAVCREAADLARALDDGVLFARVALALGAELVLGHGDDEVKRLLEEAMHRLPPGDSALRARMTARYAGARQPAADVRGPVAEAREAIDMARRLGDDDVLLYTLYAGMAAFADYVPAAERLPLNRETAALAAARGNGPYEVRARARVLFDCVELMDPVAFDAELATLDALAARLGAPAYRWVPMMFHCMRADWQGNFALADELYERAAATAPPGTGPFRMPMRQLMSLQLREPANARERLQPYADAVDTAMPSFGFARAWVETRYDPATELTIERVAANWLPTHHYQVHRAQIAGALVWHLRDPEHAAPLLELMQPRLGTSIALTGIGYVLDITVDHLCMRMAIACERWDDMDRHGAAALALSERMGARVQLAHAYVDWAEGVARMGTDPARARSLAERGAAIADELGMAGIVERCRRVLDGATAPTSAAPADPVTIEQVGEYWTLAGFGQLCRMRDSRGIQMLALLLGRPGEDIHVLELSGAQLADGGDAGELLDDQARDAYRERVGELQRELDDADACNDPGRRQRAQAELDALTAELSRAFGLGGRQRRAGGATERARSNVRRRIADAMRRIADAAPAIGEHLEREVRTGIYCSYRRD